VLIGVLQLAPYWTQIIPRDRLSRDLSRYPIVSTPYVQNALLTLDIDLSSTGASSLLAQHGVPAADIWSDLR
jgi:hypothetical protein